MTWSNDKAYVLGLWFSNSLRSKDKYIIKQIEKKFKQVNFIEGYEREKFPDIPDEYLADFIRGYFDGNGRVMNIKKNRLNSAFTSESKEFLDILLVKLREFAQVKGGSYDPSSKSIKFGTKDTIKIGKFMYKDNPELFLLRKRNKFPV